MKRRFSLDEVEAHVMSPKVIMLLSQFAYYIKRHDGIIIKLASKTVLKDVHEAHLLANDYILDDIYDRIVDELITNSSDKIPSKPRESLFAKAAKIAKSSKTNSAEVSPDSISIYN